MRDAAAIRLAWMTVSRKRGRMLLLIAATALASALIAVVSCTLATGRGVVDAGIARLTGELDARILHRAGSPFDADVLETVAAWPEVAAVAPGAYGELSLMVMDEDDSLRTDPDTGRILRKTIRAKSIDAAIDGAFEPLVLTDGRAPASPDEIIIDPLAADALNVQLGDRLKVNYIGPPVEMTIVGIEDRPRMGFLQRARVRPFVETIQQVGGRAGTITRVYIRTNDGVDVEQFCTARSDDLPEGLTIEPAMRITSQLEQRLAATDYILLVTTLLTFMCASFIIVTGLTTAVAEQQRELAMIRCVGGTRTQIFLSQILAGVIIAIAGAIIGAPLGIALAATVVWFLSDIITSGLQISSLGMTLLGIGAIISGIIGGIYPAILASRVTPMEAMASEARPPKLRRGVAIALGLTILFIGGQLLLFQIPDRDIRFWAWALVGVEILHIGYLISAIVILAIVLKLFAPALTGLLRLPRGMLARSVETHLYRNGLIAGALMVGISILISTWANATAIFDGWLGKLRFADAVAFNGAGMTPQQVAAIEGLSFVTDTTSMNALPMRVTNVQVFGLEAVPPPAITVIGFEPETFFQLNEITWARGTPEVAIPKLLSGEGVLVADRFVVARGMDIGDRITLATLGDVAAGQMNLERMMDALSTGEQPSAAPEDQTSGVGETFEVVGAVSAGGFDMIVQMFGLGRAYADFSVSCIFMDRAIMAERFGVNPDAQLLQLNLSGDITDEDAIAAVEEAGGAVKFASARWIREQLDTSATAMYLAQSIMAFIALGLAAIGVGNIVLAGVTARRYEFGVLRAVGGGRKVVAKIILGEVILLAIAGATTGTILGIHIAWIATRNSRDLLGLPVDMGLSGAIIPGIIGWIVLIAVTMLAALPGVRKATRPMPSELLATRR